MKCVSTLLFLSARAKALAGLHIPIAAGAQEQGRFILR
jgi:hypothetical protein